MSSAAAQKAQSPAQTTRYLIKTASRPWGHTSSHPGMATLITGFTWVRAGSFTTGGWHMDFAAARWRRFLCHISPEAGLSGYARVWRRALAATR
jgi:hypothetical protein